VTDRASPAPLAGIRACVFDAYGTMFDYASAAARCRDELGDDFEPRPNLSSCTLT
jgi:2-haloacid dehalogenase